MKLVLKIENYAFWVLVLGFAITILLKQHVLPPIFGMAIFFPLILLGFYYFPLIVFAKNSENVFSSNKQRLWFILSSFVLMHTCAFVSILLLIPVTQIIIYGQIVAIVNGLCFITFLVLGKNYSSLFIRHFIANFLMIAVLIFYR
jgi:hypothetical protein